MHCHPVPEHLRGMLVILVARTGEPEAQYSLGMWEEESAVDGASEAFVFYGFDGLDDVDELERLIRQAYMPC